MIGLKEYPKMAWCGAAVCSIFCIYRFDFSSTDVVRLFIYALGVFLIVTSAYLMFLKPLPGISVGGVGILFLSFELFPGDVGNLHLFNAALGAALLGVGYFLEWRQITSGQDEWQPKSGRAKANRKLHKDEWQPEPEQDEEELAAQDVYAALGISPEATNEEVTYAYRRSIKEYHPDKLVSKGLPEEMINFATRHTAEIRHAYEQIKQKRGF